MWYFVPFIILSTVPVDGAASWLNYQAGISTFHLHRAPVTFNQAFKICSAEGGVLASPLNENMKKEMILKMSDNNISCGVFTGIHSTFYKGIFTSIEGVPLESIPAEWASDEPDNYENKEECIIMTANGSLADVNCNMTLPFICYKATSDEAANICGTTDAGYKYYKSTGSCYKFHVNVALWPYAFMKCVAEKGHLVVINSDTEVQVVKEMFQKYLPVKIGNTAHAGFFRKEEPRVWYTVQGETLQQAGYSTFDNAQPDDPQLSFCGGVFRTGSLDDVRCNEFNLPFICEKPAALS